MIRARADSRRATSRRLSRRLLAHLDTGRTQRALTRVLRGQTRPLLPNRPVDVAIDFHDVPYYGETIGPDQPQFILTQEPRGTHRALHHATFAHLSRTPGSLSPCATSASGATASTRWPACSRKPAERASNFVVSTSTGSSTNTRL